MAGADPLAQRVVTPVSQHRDLVQRGSAEDQGVAEPVRDHAQVPTRRPVLPCRERPDMEDWQSVNIPEVRNAHALERISPFRRRRVDLRMVADIRKASTTGIKAR